MKEILITNTDDQIPSGPPPPEPAPTGSRRTTSRAQLWGPGRAALQNILCEWLAEASQSGVAFAFGGDGDGRRAAPAPAAGWTSTGRRPAEESGILCAMRLNSRPRAGSSVIVAAAPASAEPPGRCPSVRAILSELSWSR